MKVGVKVIALFKRREICFLAISNRVFGRKLATKIKILAETMNLLDKNQAGFERRAK